jgi:hypothetical protein
MRALNKKFEDLEIVSKRLSVVQFYEFHSLLKEIIPVMHLIAD